ncbi:transporter [Actinobacillus equuli]|nr:transporter [Actinobacillus equuli]
MKEIPDFESHKVIYSRLKRGEELIVPKVDTVLQLGDVLHLVGEKAMLHKMQLILGEEAHISLSTRARAIVLNERW